MDFEAELSRLSHDHPRLTPHLERQGELWVCHLKTMTAMYGPYAIASGEAETQEEALRRARRLIDDEIAANALLTVENKRIAELSRQREAELDAAVWAEITYPARPGG